MNIPQSIFRGYDIRGIADTELSPAVITRIGQVLGERMKATRAQVVVARDGRLSGPHLLRALIRGLEDSGMEVIDVGAQPTPLLYFACQHWQIPHGIMLTGSHNPANYNGLKIIINGESIHGEDIQALYRETLRGHYVASQGTSLSRDIETPYLNQIQTQVQLKRKMKLVIDCGNGIAGQLAPRLFESLGCEVIPLFCEVDGSFPNHHPDPTQPENLETLISQIKHHQADLGLAFDGDGDRLGVVDNEGKIIWADRQLMLYAEDLLSRNPGATVIFDVKCSAHVAKHISAKGGNPLMWKTGHSLIKAKMKETGALLAGEMSGHLFFKEQWFGFDDALYAGARLLEILSSRDESPAERFGTLPDSINTPEIHIPSADNEKFGIIERLVNETAWPGGVLTTIDGLRVDYPDGWGLVRASNTTPNLVLRFESESHVGLEKLKALFKSALHRCGIFYDIP